MTYGTDNAIDRNVHRSIVASKRTHIETVEQMLSDDEYRISLGLPREWLIQYRVGSLASLLDYQIMTFDR